MNAFPNWEGIFFIYCVKPNNLQFTYIICTRMRNTKHGTKIWKFLLTSKKMHALIWPTPKKALITSAFILGYTPMQEVAPRAVSMAVATDAIICTMNLMVSFLVIVVFCFKWLVLSVAGVPPITP